MANFLFTLRRYRGNIILRDAIVYLAKQVIELKTISTDEAERTLAMLYAYDGAVHLLASKIDDPVILDRLANTLDDMAKSVSPSR